ncbi:MAG: lysophospholipid acyltransferase family protein [Gammaproteobacteria bacterium]
MVFSKIQHYIPKLLFFALIVRPLVLFVLGLNVRHRERLPKSGPCIIAANHNSHLDTLVLMSLFPLRDLPRLRPVAAADYFLAKRWLAWFSLRVIGIIPLARGGIHSAEQLFAGCREALANGDMLILYPEGTRGAPEKIGVLKKGICCLAGGDTPYPVTPVYLYGLGKALPKGEALLVPFNVAVAVGETLTLEGDTKRALAVFEMHLQELAAECKAGIDGI